MRQKVFIISDTHFSHSNIINYEYRPFKDTDDMDEYMVERWNSVVSDNDLVFHLGDVCISGAKRAESVLSRLNGRKILIMGNHDHFTKSKWRKLGFEPYDRYFYGDYILTHIPVDETPLRRAIDEGFLKGNIHGHTHSFNQHLDQTIYRCCCVEVISYTPVTFDRFTEIHEQVIRKVAGKGLNIGDDSLFSYLLENSRPMTKEEHKEHYDALMKLSKPTGRNLFDIMGWDKDEQDTDNKKSD